VYQTRIDVTDGFITALLIVSGYALGHAPGPGFGQVAGPGAVAKVIFQELAGGYVAATLHTMTFFAIFQKDFFTQRDRFSRVGNLVIGRFLFRDCYKIWIQVMAVIVKILVFSILRCPGA